MSSFCGQLNEYKNIAIDRFDGKNLQCSAFFLSHCHSDHMVGLKSIPFLKHLQSSKDVYLYCSKVTKILLLADEECRPLEKYMQILEIGLANLVKVPSTNHSEEYYVNVTLIPAGHCPGSVMFLFEGKDGTALYTGDFCWEVGQASKVLAFQSEKSLKKIDSVYVDTTFCIAEAYNIPSRSECVDLTIPIVSDWLSLSSSHVVVIICPAKYGYEYLFKKLAQQLDTKVHVPDWKVDIYDQIPDLAGYFTSDPLLSRIHACKFYTQKLSRSTLPCSPTAHDSKQYQVLNIKPSTMWFTAQKKSSTSQEHVAVTAVNPKGLNRICYTMHSSYREIRDLISFLQPKSVLPSVLPFSDECWDIVQERLKSFLSFPNKERNKFIQTVTTNNVLGTLRKIKSSTLKPNQHHSDDFDDLFNNDEL
ncbi:protein artemis-like isoform X1 [Biomphalaria glabrata]|nr:protein artemis-like isoform X1 [Biomphalaria glabrata]